VNVLCKDVSAKEALDLNLGLWYVHFMNINRAPAGVDHFKSLQILDELSSNDSLTQRDLSSRLGIALGLVNSYIKNLVAKGFITVKTIPSKRYAYYLTPKGFAEKTRLTYHLLQDYTRIYREARSNFRALFKDMSTRGIKKVVFAGSDEVAEIAYITMQEMKLELVGVVDTEKYGVAFFGETIKPLDSLKSMKYDCVVVATHLSKDKIYHGLLERGVDKRIIQRIF
jgi:DNA-binding MarR family transcriptional regulator